MFTRELGRHIRVRIRRSLCGNNQGTPSTLGCLPQGGGLNSVVAFFNRRLEDERARVTDEKSKQPA